MMQSLQRKMSLALAMIFCLCLTYAARGQNVTVTGRITSSNGNDPVPGVNVIVKGTSNGTTTDADGKYSIAAGSDAVLVFSFIGFQTQEVAVGNRSTVDVSLAEDITQLGEVVVTALGVEKETARLGYSLSQVNGDLMNQARETNVAMSLEGRVAGLNVKGTSGGPGSTTKILLRGMPSMNSGGAPLFVINGVPMDNTQRGSSGEWGGADQGDGIGNLNPDDIETMTVLKGQSASALYGARASNGVILITTKKGKKGDFAVEYNMNYQMDKAMDLTDWQYEYGQGEFGGKPVDAAQAQKTSRMSWGAKMDGSQVIQYDGKTYAYSPFKDNIKNFYRTGGTFTNTVSVSKGTETGSFRLSLSNMDNSAIVRNSGLGRKTLNLNLEQKVTDKLKVNVMANYIDELYKNKPQLSDGPQNPNNGLFLATNVDERILNPGFDPVTGHEIRYGDDEYVTNPWFVVNQYVNNVGRKRLISAVSARYDLTSWLYAQARVGYDLMHDKVFKVEPWGSAYTTGFQGNLQEQSTREAFEMNADGLIGVDKELNSDLSLSALVGANLRKNQFEYERLAGSTFILPYIYAMSNILTPNNNANDNYKVGKSEVHSAYYSADLTYKGFLTLNTTGRYDKYSNLPIGKQSIFTPSVSGSLIFSELMDLRSLSFGKLRASWANTSGEVGEAYKTSVYYSLGNALNGTPMGTFATDLPNVSLKPFTVTEIEVGTELKFFENRLGFDVAWYTRKTKNEIMPATFSAASGYTTGLVGTGSTKNTGLEVLITGAPVKTTNFGWNVSLNFTTVKNTVLETDADGKDQVQGQNRGTLGNAVTAFVKGFAGPQILAYDYQYANNGEIIVDGSGVPIKGDLKEYGSVLPKFYGGVTNDFSYKSFNLSFLIDFNYGNKILSATEYYSIFRGLNKMTLTGRDGITTGVINAEGTPNTVQANAQDYYKAVSQQITSTSVVDGDFIKLRQVTFGYSIPAALLTKLPLFRSVQISLVARNLAILMRKAKNIDPESSMGSTLKYYGIEGTNLPSTRTYGVNLHFKFK